MCYGYVESFDHLMDFKRYRKFTVEECAPLTLEKSVVFLTQLGDYPM